MPADAAPAGGAGDLEARLAARADALAAGAPSVPKRVVLWGVAAAAVLALGGTLLERVFTSAGLNSVGATTTTTRPTTPGVPLDLAAATLLSAETTAASRAPDFDLTASPSGAPVRLGALRGRVVVVSFFDASCTDQCAALSAELHVADAALGADRAHVVLVTINTDPLELAVRPTPRAVSASGLGAAPNWRFLTGPLRSLDAVWHAYDVSVAVYPTQRLVVHTDPLWVVTARGRLALRLEPLLVQPRSGHYDLPAVLVRRAGLGLAAELEAVVRSGR